MYSSQDLQNDWCYTRIQRHNQHDSGASQWQLCTLKTSLWWNLTEDLQKKRSEHPQISGRWACRITTKLPGGSDVQNIYILMGFLQGLFIIKYGKVNLEKKTLIPVNAWDVRLPLKTSSTFTWEGQQISEGPIGLTWSGLRKWSHDFVHLCADTKAPGCDLDHKEHLENRWLCAGNLISVVIESNHELPRKEQLHRSYSSRPLRQSNISTCKDLVVILNNIKQLSGFMAITMIW